MAEPMNKVTGRESLAEAAKCRRCHDHHREADRARGAASSKGCVGEESDG